MLRVIHTADTHIGYRQYHSDARRRDFLAAFEAVIDDAIDGEVDAVVHAGDLFHDKRPDLPDLQGTVAALRRLRRAEIPFYGIVGNHERKRDAQWLDLFADLGLASRLGPTPTTIDGLALYGLDYESPATRDLDATAFADDGDHVAAVLVGHGIIEGLPYGDWDLDALLASASVDVDAVLLGDYHEHELERRDGTVVTYPGSTERASADERAPRGYNVVTVDDDGSVSVAHRSVPETRRFVYVDVDLPAGAGEARVRERLDEHELDEAVVIVTVEGAGESISTAAIEAHATDNGALVARVRDRRRAGEGAAGEGGLSVHFADPDRAVRAALSETTVSEAAYQLDDLVRDGAIPDSRVRERARLTIDGLIEDDPAALRRPADGDDPSEDPSPDETDAATSADAEAATERSTTATPADEGDLSTADTGPDEDEPDEATERDPDVVATASDGQASMEDYL